MKLRNIEVGDILDGAKLYLEDFFTTNLEAICEYVWSQPIIMFGPIDIWTDVCDSFDETNLQYSSFLTILSNMSDTFGILDYSKLRLRGGDMFSAMEEALIFILQKDSNTGEINFEKYPPEDYCYQLSNNVGVVTNITDPDNIIYKNIYVDDDEIKKITNTGLAYNNDSIELLTADTKYWPRTLHVNGNVNVNGNASISIPDDLKIVTFQDGTNDEIGKMLNAHYNGIINIEDYWNIGDTRQINSQGGSDWLITATIVAFNHDELAEPVGIRHKAAITIQTREVLNSWTQGYNEEDTAFINGSNDFDMTFTKWSQLLLKKWLDQIDLCYDPDYFDFRDMLKKVQHKRLKSNGAETTDTEIVIETLFLPSYTEVFGNIPYQNYINGIEPNDLEGSQWDYYKIESNRIKYGNNSGSPNDVACQWWLSSPASTYNETEGYAWCFVYSDGTVNINYGNEAAAVAFAFCI